MNTSHLLGPFGRFGPRDALAHWRALPLGSRRLLIAGTSALLVAAGLQIAARIWDGDARTLDRTRPTRADTPRAAQTVPGPIRPALAQAAALPDEGSRLQRLSRLIDDARGHGLQVRSVREEPPSAAPGTAIGSQAVSLQLHGDYAALRAHLARVLADDPALVLASVHLRRTDLDRAQLQADVRWVLLSAAGPRS